MISFSESIIRPLYDYFYNEEHFASNNNNYSEELKQSTKKIKVNTINKTKPFITINKTKGYTKNNIVLSESEESSLKKKHHHKRFYNNGSYYDDDYEEERGV